MERGSLKRARRAWLEGSARAQYYHTESYPEVPDTEVVEKRPSYVIRVRSIQGRSYLNIYNTFVGYQPIYSEYCGQPLSDHYNKN